MILPILCLAGVSLIISSLSTCLMIPLAPRFALVDQPGHRKIHATPKPLGGGVAIFSSIALPLVGWLLLAWDLHSKGMLLTRRLPDDLQAALIGGTLKQSRLLLTFLFSLLGLHILGLLD